jgi:MHS family proline/betaine transporter-like MFS transporter
MEQAPPHKKAYTASWATCGGNIGLLSASLFCWVLTQYCTPQQLYAWGWRVPFLFALLGGGVTLYLRYHITEVFHFQKPANAPAPLLQVLLHQKKSLLLLLCLSCFYMVVCYLIYMWSTTYLTHIAHLSMRNALAINSLALALQILLIPAVAGLSDKIGRKPLLLFGIGSLALGIYPYYLILHTGHLMWITLAHLGISFFAAFFTSILPITIAELIPASSRYSGVGLGYNLAGMLVGGTTPLIGMLLIEMNHGTMLISLYFIFWALLAGVGTLSAFGGHGQKATFAHPTL